MKKIIKNWVGFYHKITLKYGKEDEEHFNNHRWNRREQGRGV